MGNVAALETLLTIVLLGLSNRKLPPKIPS